MHHKNSDDEIYFLLLLGTVLAALAYILLNDMF